MGGRQEGETEREGKRTKRMRNGVPIRSSASPPCPAVPASPLANSAGSLLPEPLRAEYPFESNFLDLGNVQSHFVDAGSGSPILFVHGNPTWSFAWRNFVKDLKHDYRVVAVDHVGMGLSEKPADYDYTLKQHVENLVRLIDELDLQEITLVGHDWGGCIGMGAAVREPHRFRRFVMMNTAAFRSKRLPLRIAACRIPWLGEFGVRGLNLFSRAALSMATAKPERMTPAICQGYLFPYDNWEHRIGVHRFVQDIPLRPTHPSHETLVEIEEGLSRFREHPWLFVWGEKDWCFTTAFLDEWIERFPGAEVARFPNAGHYVFEDAFEQILPRLREFLLKSSGLPNRN